MLPASLELVSPESGVKETELILEAVQVGDDREDMGRLCRLGGWNVHGRRGAGGSVSILGSFKGLTM